MRELIEPCKSCLGCMRLENPYFIGDRNCRYNNELSNKISDKKYVQEKIKNYGKSRDTI